MFVVPVIAAVPRAVKSLASYPRLQNGVSAARTQIERSGESGDGAAAADESKQVRMCVRRRMLSARLSSRGRQQQQIRPSRCRANHLDQATGSFFSIGITSFRRATHRCSTPFTPVTCNGEHCWSRQRQQWHPRPQPHSSELSPKPGRHLGRCCWQEEAPQPSGWQAPLRQGCWRHEEEQACSGHCGCLKRALWSVFVAS